MAKLEYSILLNASPEKVFAYVSDYEKWAKWYVGTSNFVATSNIKKGNGAKYKYKAKMMGFTTTVETKITEFVENKGWVGVSTQGLSHKTFWQFEEKNGKTLFTHGLEYKLPIPLIGNFLDTLFVKPQWDKLVETSLKNLEKKFPGN